MSDVIIKKVETKAEHRAFFELPWKLYKNDPNWVPPLKSQRRDTLDKKKNPAWEYMEGDYFLAWRSKEVVGSIAAFVNHRHNEFANENIAWFGMFETIEDQTVSDALLDTAIKWAKDHGYDALKGPANFTLHEECGLLIENFDPPVILMPYNPPFYQQLIENKGFNKAMDVHSTYYDYELLAQSNLLERLEKITSRLMKRGNITVRNIDMSRKDEEFVKFKEIYNDAWASNWGFVPMTEKELDALVDSLGQLLDPNLAIFAEVNGHLAGFVMSIPNINQALAKVRTSPKTPEIWSLLKLLYYWKFTNTVDSCRMPLLGIREEYRNMGIYQILTKAMLENVMNNTSYQWQDAGWVLETNPLVDMVIKLGGTTYKTYRFYIMPIKD